MCLPQKTAAALGGFGPLALCTRVSNTLTLTDPQTLRSVQMDVSAYSLSLAPCCADKTIERCVCGEHVCFHAFSCLALSPTPIVSSAFATAYVAITCCLPCGERPQAKITARRSCQLPKLCNVMWCEGHAITRCLALSQANAYWRQPFEPALNSRQLVEFVVLDIDVDAGAPSGRFKLADVQVSFSIEGCF